MSSTSGYLKAIANFFEKEFKCELCPYTLHRVCDARKQGDEVACIEVAVLCRKEAE